MAEQMAAATGTDVVVIGAGPCGLFAVFELGMLKMRAVVVDALDMAGGQCAALYPEKPIYDIPGHPSILAQDLIDRLVAQAAPFAPEYRLGRQVVSMERQPDGMIQVATDRGEVIAARAVVVAAGAGAFGPNRPPLAGIEAFEGAAHPARGVKYLVRRREDFRDARVVIAGGGDSAVDWAISLAEVAARIQVVHRRPKFRAAPESVARLEALAAQGRIELVIPYQLHGLDGEDGRLTGVLVSDLSGGVRRLDADVLLPFFGLAMSLGPLAEWGFELERGHIKVRPQDCATALPGVFAIGDIAAYPGKLKLILQGFAEAAMAAHAIHPLVHAGEALHFEYSTSKGLPASL